MATEPVHPRAARRPSDPQSSPPAFLNHNHKRQRSQTVGTTFVSTTVVPAPSSTDVLSSLISSLTLLSDSAREQIRSARELESTLYDPSPEAPVAVLSSTHDLHHKASTSTEYHSVIDYSDGEEAEPPVVGYGRSRNKDQRPSSLKDKWSLHGAGKDKGSNSIRSGSSANMRRPTSGASSVMGVPSIERAYTGSSSSLAAPPSTGARSPIKMFFSSRPDEEFTHSAVTLPRDVDVKSVKSVKGIKTNRLKHSMSVSQEQEQGPYPLSPVMAMEEQSPPRRKESFTPEHKTYSPLSPVNREDLGEHLIPSRRSSMRHGPGQRESSKGRSPVAGRASSLHSNSLSAAGTDPIDIGINEEPFDVEDSTLRRIRELQQAKEKRHLEWRKESKRSERLVKRPSRSRSKSTEDRRPSHASYVDPTGLDKYEHDDPRQVKSQDRSDLESVSTPVVHEIIVPSPSPNLIPTMPSPALSTPRKHKRSLSAGLRRSGSSKYRPTDDLRSVQEQVETYLTAPRLTQRIRHPRTGRTIAFSEVGDPRGFAVFCCVGMGLTRYVTSFYDDIARTQKLRLITPDRPGIGESSPFPENVCTPLAWVDDVEIICQTLGIDKFSLLAHSAGSIYALATALKLPGRVRGRIHLLAPWIPPSQFPHGSSTGEIKVANLPIAHKLLSVLPTPLLKAANSRFLSATSASIDPRSSRSKKKDRATSLTYDVILAEMEADMQSASRAPSDVASIRHSSLSQYARTPTTTPPPYNFQNGILSPPLSPSPTNMKRQMSSSAIKIRSPTPNEGLGLTPAARQALLNSELTHRTWALATVNANPAADLLVCLERRRPIGFKYVDVTRGVVIHHGRNDARVPLDNVQWLSGAMKRCELRILNDEGHGLMASATVMSRVLGEIGREWEEWDVIARENERTRLEQENELDRFKEMERKRFLRGIH